MRNFIEKGDVITVIAPYSVFGGQGVQVGGLFGVAASDAANGVPVEIKRAGVFDISAVQTDTASQGAKIYWDNTARRLTTTATNNILVGAVTVAKTAVDTAARVLLDGVVR